MININFNWRGVSYMNLPIQFGYIGPHRYYTLTAPAYNYICVVYYNYHAWWQPAIGHHRNLFVLRSKWFKPLLSY